MIIQTIEEQSIEEQAIMAAAPIARDSSHQDYICGVCLDFLEEPTKTCCNHIFCKTCLEQTVDSTHMCPTCRCPVQLSQIQPAQVMDRKMRTRILDCSRCNQQFKPIDGREHDRVCVVHFVPERRTLTGLNITANTQVFPCAYCGSTNFSRESLIAHCNANHKTAPNHKLVCTICVAYPWGNNNQVSGHLLEHMNLRHQFDYDRFVDLQEDEEVSLQDALEMSTM